MHCKHVWIYVRMCGPRDTMHRCYRCGAIRVSNILPDCIVLGED